MKPLNKITSYSIRIDALNKTYLLKLTIVDMEQHVEIPFSSLMELAACVDLLRNEDNTYYNPANGEIVITWEPTGENDPKHIK
jgi:hypothetical protein